MSIDFSNDKAIYLQICDAIKMDIISGKYVAGEKLPSVRDLAMHFRVNPNTMQRAFSQLEDEGLVYTERTNGRFVSKEAKRMEEEKSKLVMEKIDAFLDYMHSLGLSNDEIVDQIKQARKGENK